MCKEAESHIRGTRQLANDHTYDNGIFLKTEHWEIFTAGLHSHVQTLSCIMWESPYTIMLSGLHMIPDTHTSSAASGFGIKTCDNAADFHTAKIEVIQTRLSGHHQSLAEFYYIKTPLRNVQHRISQATPCLNCMHCRGASDSLKFCTPFLKSLKYFLDLASQSQWKTSFWNLDHTLIVFMRK